MKLIYRTICLVLGALLGAGCDDPHDPDPEYGPIAEYGVPTATLRVSGWVRNAAGEAIPGIEVQFEGSVRDTTNVLGLWSIERQGIFLPCSHGGAACQVTARDIDGAVQGSYASRTVDLELIQVQPGNGGWDEGTWEDSDVEIILPEAGEPEKDGP